MSSPLFDLLEANNILIDEKRVKNCLKVVHNRVENYFALGVVSHSNSQFLGHCHFSLSVSQSQSLSLSPCLSMCLPVCLYVSLSVSPFPGLPPRLPVCLPSPWLSLSPCLPFHIPACLPVCFPVSILPAARGEPPRTPLGRVMESHRVPPPSALVLAATALTAPPLSLPAASNPEGGDDHGAVNRRHPQQLRVAGPRRGATVPAQVLGTHHGVRATREYARFVMCVPGTRVLSGNYIRLTLLADVAVPMMQHAPTSCYHRPFVRSQNPGRSCMLLN